MSSWLDAQLRAALEERRERGLMRALRPVPLGALDLASNDYLGLARHPTVIAAACVAAQDYGAGARASRLVSGHGNAHAQLEEELAIWKGVEAALVLPSGYQANLATVTALARRGDWVLCDKRNHASLIDACRLAEANGATVRFYGSIVKLEALLQKSPCPLVRRLIVTDTVFSMDGDLAELPRLTAMARRFEAVLLLDDAHGTGTLGQTGRGVMEHFGLHPDEVACVHIGTLSKALGSQGGFVAGSRILVDWLVNAARSFIYTTGLNPPACGAASEA